MFQKLHQQYKKDILELANTPDPKKSKKFTQYCQKMIEQYENNTINIHELGYLIANTIQYPTLTADNLTNEIITLAGEMELPENIQSQSAGDNYQELKNLIKKLNENLKRTQY
ncbi:MAG TPA: hypothetical protein PLH65_02355 [bacterium]|nr:hypothetical protein [bacterium]